MENSNNLTIRPQKNKPVSVAALIKEFKLKTQGITNEMTVRGITLSSADVRPGDLYVGMPGANRHGAEFARQAQAAGATAILTDAKGAELAEGVDLPILVTTQNPRQIMGAVAATIFGTVNTKMLTFGITGTNGKTSVVYMLDALLRVAGKTTGISSTAERRIGDTAIESDLTSPESSELHALLARMQEENVEAVAIEVSAQAVKRKRIDGVLFDVIAFNNFSQDHLDEFGDMETYFKEKQNFFVPEHAKKAVVVVDSKYGQRIAKESKIPVTTLSTEYGRSADWHLAITHHTINGVSFVLQGPDNAYFRGRVPIFGSFMAENAALALIMLHEAGINIEEIAQRLGSDPVPITIPGRLELMSDPQVGPRFYVDYGHTPGSFTSMLEALDEVREGKIIFMFGADGDRDTTKREEMGRIASYGSDVLIVCDYHPRYEDPAAIRAQLIAGANDTGRPAQIHEIADPKQAIRFAISQAGPKDIIVYAGPGHESYQEVAGNMIPYSARDEVRGALREAGLLT